MPIRGFARTSEFRWKANRQVRRLRSIDKPTTVIPLANDDCVTIDLIWGVVDTVFETNFPDIRNRCAIHSENGSAMVIPREGDKVRLYIQLSDKQVVDPATGRVDKNRVSPDHIIQVETLSHIFSCRRPLSFDPQAAKKIIRPYTIAAREIDWWTIYISASPFAPHCNKSPLNCRTQLVNESRPSFPSTSGFSSPVMLATRTPPRLDRV